MRKRKKLSKPLSKDHSPEPEIIGVNKMEISPAVQIPSSPDSNFDQGPLFPVLEERGKAKVPEGAQGQRPHVTLGNPNVGKIKMGQLSLQEKWTKT